MGFNKGGDRKRTHAEFNRRAQNQIHEDRRDQRKEEQQDMYARAYAARDRKQRKTNLPPRQNPIISKEAWDQQVTVLIQRFSIDLFEKKIWLKNSKIFSDLD